MTLPVIRSPLSGRRPYTPYNHQVLHCDPTFFSTSPFRTLVSIKLLYLPETCFCLARLRPPYRPELFVIHDPGSAFTYTHTRGFAHCPDHFCAIQGADTESLGPQRAFQRLVELLQSLFHTARLSSASCMHKQASCCSRRLAWSVSPCS